MSTEAISKRQRSPEIENSAALALRGATNSSDDSSYNTDDYSSSSESDISSLIEEDIEQVVDQEQEEDMPKKGSRKKDKGADLLSDTLGNIIIGSQQPILFPILRYKWTDTGENKRVTLDVLLPGGTEGRQLRCTVVQGGKMIMIHYDYPQVFVKPGRLSKASTGAVMSGHSKWVGMVEEVRSLQQDYGRMVGVMKVHLPFACEEIFVQDGVVSGETICMYDHEFVDYNTAKQYNYILHLELQSVEKVKKLASQCVATKLITGAVVTPVTSPGNPFVTGGVGP